MRYDAMFERMSILCTPTDHSSRAELRYRTSLSIVRVLRILDTTGMSPRTSYVEYSLPFLDDAKRMRRASMQVLADFCCHRRRHVVARMTIDHRICPRIERDEVSCACNLAVGEQL